jgi:cell volume regulation protein A
MSAYTDFFPDLFAFAALVVVAIAAAPLAARIGLPGPAAFLGVGILAAVTGLVPADALTPLQLEQIGTIALYAILFQGGLVTGFAEWRRCARPILLLGLPGTAATAAALAAIGHYVLGLDWSLAALAGIALAPTDPAAVYSVLRGGDQTRARTVLEGESGFNDPVGISLMLAAVAYIGPNGDTLGEGAVRFAGELGIGAAVGVVAGLVFAAVLRATPDVADELQGVGIFAGAVLVGAGTATLHGSGFLAVFIVGLLAADAWREQDGDYHLVTNAAAAISEPLIFGLLGAAFAAMVGWPELAYGIALTVATAFVVRPVVAWAGTMRSGLTPAERSLVSWGGLKGAVPLLLAAYPALELLDGAARVEGIVLVATVASILLQGATLSTFARRATPDHEAGARAEARTPTRDSD